MHHDRGQPGEGNGFQAASASLIVESHWRLVGKAAAFGAWVPPWKRRPLLVADW